MRIILLSLLLLSCINSHAAFDAVQLILEQQFEQPLRWDNVEGGSEWFGGEPIQRQGWTGQHRIHLGPGEHTAIRVPSDEMLRIVRRDGEPLTNEDIEISQSNGNGLAKVITALVDPDNSHLIVTPEANSDQLLHVQRPAHLEHSVDLMLYVSRREHWHKIAPHRQLIELPGEYVELRRDKDAVTKPYWRLDKTATQIKINGPARLLLEQRYIFQNNDHAMLQSYRLYSRLDEIPAQSHIVETGPETLHPLSINGRATALGRLEQRYFNIPAGQHTLSLSSTAPLYVRLIQQIDSDYLLPGLNAPKIQAAETWKEAQQTDSFAEKSLQNAWQIVQDNSRREGVLHGAANLKQTMMKEHQPLVAETNRLANAHSFYRDLPPDTVQTITPEPAWFTNPSLIRWPQLNRTRVMAEQHIESAIAGLGKAVFYKVSRQSQHFSLPKRHSPSKLRLLLNQADIEQDQTLWLQFDQQPPLKIKASTSLIASKAQWLADRGESGLWLQSHRHQQHHSPTLDGAFAQREIPAPLIDVATLELDLPAHVQTIRLWPDPTSISAPRIALQYQTSAVYKLSQTDYLAAWEKGSTKNFDGERLSRLLNMPITTLNENEKLLANHWQPLRRLMHSQQQRFKQNVSAASAIKPTSDSQNIHHTKKLITQAQAAQQHSWIDALASWRKATLLAADETRIVAAMGQVGALQNLGEHHLAEHLLKGIYLHDLDTSMRQAAFQQLLKHYQHTQNISAQQALLASEILREPSIGSVTHYANLLLDDGKIEMALWLAWALPPTDNIANLQLSAAYQNGWWLMFEQALKQASEEDAAIWQGYRAQSQGRYQDALQHWREGGQQGQALTSHLNSGLKLRTALDSLNEETLSAWSAWQLQHPGPWRWRKETGLITEAAAAATLYVIERDLMTSAYRGSKDQSVKLRLAGPAQLRLKVRPVHQRPFVTPLSGWLQLRDGAQQWVLPFHNNYPSSDLHWIGQTDALAGTNEVLEYNVGSGIHELELSAGEFDFLASAEVYRPQIPLAVLPPITPSTLTEFSQHNYASRDTLAVHCDLFGQEALLYICKHKDKQTHSGDSKPLVTQWPFPNIETTKLAALQHTPVNINDTEVNRHSDAREQIIQWLWLAKRNPQRLLEAASEVEALALAEPINPNLKKLAAALVQQTRWQTITNVSHSAGLRYRQVTGWQPESAFGQTRRILLDIEDPSVHIVGRHAKLGLAMNNRRATRIKLALSLASLPYASASQTRLEVNLNDNQAHTVMIRPDGNTTNLELDIPAGHHALRFTLRDSVANQFVQVRLWERPADSHNADFIPLLRESRRAYHIATANEPIRLQLQGPGLIRADAQQGDSVVQDFRKLVAGWQELVFYPHPEQKQTLYRFYRRVNDQNTPTKSIRTGAELSPKPVPWPELQIDPITTQPLLGVVDTLPLMGQEDGTWSFTARMVNRRQVDEDSRSQAAERFLELRTDHRHYDPFQHSYYQGWLLARLREEGGATLAGNGRWQHQPRWHSFRLGMQGSLYLQSPNGSNTEWAATWRGELSQRRDIDLKTHHRIYAKLFQRWLSLDDFEAYRRAELDQDVFSRYKADHRRGLTLGDRLSHRPWLDTEWYGNLSLHSNESLLPWRYDYFNAKGGWRQLLGSFQIDAEFGYRHYRSDEDRASSLTRKHLKLDVEWNRWHSRWRRWQVQFQIRRDLDVSDTSFWLGLSWHGGNGRGLRDFRHGEAAFRNLREQQRPHQINNELIFGDRHE